MQLNTSTLPRLAVAKPSYDRDRIGIGIVHFGVGVMPADHGMKERCNPRTASTP
jgi:hypothetical protein